MNGIVVGVDGSEGAAQALRWAVLESALRDRPVTAILVWSFLDQHAPPGDHAFDPAYGEPAALTALDEAVTGALGADAETAVARRVVCDLPARGLLEASADADLLVVGARGLGGFRGLLLGSVSQQCLHHAGRPLAIVHVEAVATEGMSERVVVGVDGSKPARRALQWAADEARLRGAALEVVHAWRPPISVAGAAPGASGSFDPTDIETAARETLDAAIDGIDTSGLGAPVDRLLANGSAAWAILEVSKRADLVVVGSRGRGGFAGLVLGSTSHQVAHHAGCPVVVIPAHRERLSYMLD